MKTNNRFRPVHTWVQYTQRFVWHIDSPSGVSVRMDNAHRLPVRFRQVNLFEKQTFCFFFNSQFTFYIGPLK